MLTDRLVLAGVATLSAVATAGWVRQTPVSYAPQATNLTAPLVETESFTPVQSAAFSPAGNLPVRHVSATPVKAQPVQYAQRRPIRRAYDDRRVYDDRREGTQRSTAKSAAIVAGGAAAGAAIGGLAGGGKGAAIGAITGGGGALVYDRMTHKKNDGFGYRSNGATYRDDDIYREPRSKGKSAAIIGGSAAAGAAVGGIAGGGKGAVIGALGGGAAGLIYDRVTRNK